MPILSSDYQHHRVPFLSYARFGPGMILLFVLMILMIILLLYARLEYLAAVVAVAAFLILGIKSFEMLQTGDPLEKNLIGKKCLVIRTVSRAQRGIVKVYKEGGRELDPELWTAESMGDSVIEENQPAKVVGSFGIILLIEPESSEKS